MALTIYAKAGLLRSVTASRPRQQILALRPRTNIAGRVETAYLMTVPQEVLPGTDYVRMYMRDRVLSTNYDSRQTSAILALPCIISSISSSASYDTVWSTDSNADDRRNATSGESPATAQRDRPSRIYRTRPLVCLFVKYQIIVKYARP